MVRNLWPLLGVFLACACSGEDLSYAERRNAPPLKAPVIAVTDAERFGARTLQADPGLQESPLTWRTPPGWEVLPRTSMRLANFGVGAGGECYLTVLAGSGGGTLGNVNRWREQMGLGPMTDGEVEALPKIQLLQSEAHLVELEGGFRGMGSQVREGWALRGAIFGSDRFTVFVKFTGPQEVVALEADAFDDFCSSISLRESPTSGASSQERSGHGASGGIGWDAPPEWHVEAGGGMRLVTFRKGEVECYLTVLGGDGGGTASNIQRWVGQLGLTPPSVAEVEAMPTVNVMGVQSPLLEATGEYSGMGAADPVPDTTLFGIVCLLEDRAVFVKMLGPSAQVSAERDRFTAFVASMHLEGDGH